jgi:hypothetical protein
MSGPVVNFDAKSSLVYVRLVYWAIGFLIALLRAIVFEVDGEVRRRVCIKVQLLYTPRNQVLYVVQCFRRLPAATGAVGGLQCSGNRAQAKGCLVFPNRTWRLEQRPVYRYDRSGRRSFNHLDWKRPRNGGAFWSLLQPENRVFKIGLKNHPVQWRTRS